MSKAAKVSDAVAPYFVEKLAGLDAVPRVPLLEVAELNPKRFTNPPKDYDTVSFIPMKAVEEETGHLDATEVRPWSAVRKGYTPFQEGDVIFAKITPCMENGKYAIAQGLHGGRAAGSTEFHVLRPSPMLDPQYLLYYLFRSDVRQAARHNMQGAAGQLRVPAKFFEGLEIPCPPVEDQRRIVAEIEEQLTRLEAGVAALKRVQANLKRYKNAVLKAAVEGRLVPTEQPWTQMKLGEIALSIRNGYPKKPNAEQGMRIFRISAVRPLELDVEDVRFLSGDSSDYEPFLVAPGDVLFTRYNGSRDYVGVCALVPMDLPPTAYPDKLIRVRIPVSTVLPEFLVIAASTGRAREYIESKIRTTAGQSGISGGDLKSLPLEIPGLTEQHRIVAEVDRHFSVIEETEIQVQDDLARAARLRQAVLQSAFSLLSR